MQQCTLQTKIGLAYAEITVLLSCSAAVRWRILEFSFVLNKTRSPFEICTKILQIM